MKTLFTLILSLFCYFCGNSFTSGLQSNSSLEITDTSRLENISFKDDDECDCDNYDEDDCDEDDCPDLVPINLTYFRADVSNYKVNLRWTTASELNNDYFEIERTLDFYYFESVGIIKGAGTSNERKNYFFQDNYPQEGLNYYRLKQVDFNGKFEYSNFVSVEYPQEDKVSLIFNLNKIFVSTNEEIGRIIVTDLTGSVKASSIYNNFVNISEMPIGIYMIFVFNKGDQIILAQKFSNTSVVGGNMGELLE